MIGCNLVKEKSSSDWNLPILYFTQPNLYKNNIQLSALLLQPDTKLVLLLFWSSRDTPSEFELPYGQEIYKKYIGKGLVVIGINTDTNTVLKEPLITRIQTVTDQNNRPSLLTYPIVWDVDNTVMKQYGIVTLPAHVLISKSNKIKYIHSGFSDELMNELSTKINDLL